MPKFFILEDSPQRMSHFTHAFGRDNIVHKDNAAEFIAALEADALNSDPIDVILLDNDLSSGSGGFALKNTGYDVARWMVDNQVDVKLVVVHTMDIVTGDEMVWRLKYEGYNVQRVPFVEMNFEGDLKEGLLSVANMTDE